MAPMSPGAALRQLRAAHADLKRVRQLMKQAREDARATPSVFRAGWESLTQAHRLMASIPAAAVDDAVLTQQISVQRYATALLVRLRRLLRREEIEPGDEDSQNLDDFD